MADKNDCIAPNQKIEKKVYRSESQKMQEYNSIKEWSTCDDLVKILLSQKVIEAASIKAELSNPFEKIDSYKNIDIYDSYLSFQNVKRSDIEKLNLKPG